MASSVNSVLGASAGAASNQSSSSTGLGGVAPSEGVFLQLLVSQLKNQDPMNPADSTTFVTQLAQFSELEQVIGIRSDTDALATDATAATGGAPTTGSTSTNSSTTNQTSSN